MAGTACSPDELRRLADLLANNKVGEVKVEIDPGGVSEVDNPVVAEVRRKLNWFGNVRTMRAAFNPEFSAQVIDPLILQTNKYDSFRSAAHKAFLDALEPMGIKGWYKRAMSANPKQNKALYDAIMNLDESGKYVGPNVSTETGILESARRLNEYLVNMGKANGIRLSMYKEYRRAVDANGGKGGLMYLDIPWSRAFKGTLTKDEADFFWELERRGIMRNWEPSMSGFFQDYVNSVGSKRILTPFINKLEDEIVRPYFGAKFSRTSVGLSSYAQDSVGFQMWLNLKDHIYGQPTDMDKKIAAAWDRMFNLTGMKRRTTAYDVYGVASAVSNLLYGGVLSTPGSVIKQIFQLGPTYAELGVRPVVWGVHKLFDKPFVDKLIQRGILQSPLEAIHDQVSFARTTGRLIHKSTETLLTVFEGADRTMRIITAGAADLRFKEAMSAGIETLRAQREVKEQIVKLVNRGRVEDAWDLYLIDVMSKTQFSYGRANRSELMRGALGQTISMLQSYPLNWIEMYNMMGKRFVRGAKGALGKGDEPWTEMLPLIRQLGLTTGIVLGGANAFGTDLRSNFISFPGQAPVPQLVGATLTSGKTNFEWMFGHLFGLGETDYHKRLRSEANNQFARNVSNFVPGGLMFKKTRDVIDEPTFVNVMRLMGFPPMAEEINLEIRAKAAQTRKEKQFERMFD